MRRRGDPFIAVVCIAALIVLAGVAVGIWFYNGGLGSL